MVPTIESAHPPSSLSESEREKVREQLNRLLETHHFRNSKRYPALLRFIVEETLEGRGEFLKERLIGVQVFDRPADYDTATDPVVRVTIAEIRKRIAQYYHDEAHDAEMRIELLPGRYMPEFRARVRRDAVDAVDQADSRAAQADSRAAHAGAGGAAAGADAVASSTEAEPEAHADEPAVAPAAAVRGTRWRWFAGGLALALVAAFAGAVQWMRMSGPLDELWGPMLRGAQPVLFCVPTKAERKHGPMGDLEEEVNPAISSLVRAPGVTSPGTTFLAKEALGENVVYSDMLATLRMANVLAVRRHEYRSKLNVDTTLEDLREGPAILVGGLDNQWTMRALAPLRFRFAGDGKDTYWIADAQNPGSRQWSLNLRQQYGEVTRDYAIIARLHNEQTGEAELIVAGIGMSGTAAAGEFVTDPQKVQELRARLGAGMRDRNFEAVLSTDVVSGMAGSPHVEAVAVW